LPSTSGTKGVSQTNKGKGKESLVGTINQTISVLVECPAIQMTNPGGEQVGEKKFLNEENSNGSITRPYLDTTLVRRILKKESEIVVHKGAPSRRREKHDLRGEPSKS